MEQFCREINMPQEVTDILMHLESTPNFHPDAEMLRHPETWEEGLNILRQTLGNDPQGFKMLYCHLKCAIEARAIYRKLRLSDKIYFDTMAIFSRMVREHMESYGTYGFDRAFWTVRQVSCKLFRIGQLEYELVKTDARHVISLHIPSDADLSLPLLRNSWEQASEILNRSFPEYRQAPMVCHSWLLSPDLDEFLPADSKILAFRRSFNLTACGDGREDVLLWVFKNPKLSLENLPENTSLQRKLKVHLLRNGSFALGQGTLIDEPFLR